ncbi:superoxide dismutase family protein [Tissierella creatinophila]|uniref:Superoxide dismutase [Cu-Zn] n=1 Tax=Tissierella creatinophila DSM 6911 TaxID=1123403 RepID=A0A1U7M733_TISCR|nr:superoxide dismutase family protein [Tissierella creatinophila]OLS03096.1 superoxide dismutase [Cu-Zn] precursor [Tissierella creatinophila DSM 6911]
MSKMINRAHARMMGSKYAPHLCGNLYFYAVEEGTEVFVEVWGLPLYEPGTDEKDPIGPLGFHIHELGVCEIKDPQNPFTSAGGHYNPDNQPHGNHAGDFPVLFSNNGYSRMSFFTDRFKVKDIIGRSVIIHLNPDDYRTQPAGDSGKRIGCGVIKDI